MSCIGAHHSAIVAGTLLHWSEIGQGRPLVLLHGLSDSHRTWRFVAEALSVDRRVLMLDLPGHGLSGRPEAPYDLDWHADMVGEWIDFMGFDEVDIVGHSFGGGVAQYLLLTHAEKVRRLGLVAPGGLGQEVALGLRLLSLPGAEAIVRPFLSIGVRIAYARLAAGAFPDDDRDWLARVSRTPGSARALTKTVRGVINLRGQHRQVLDHIGEVEQLPPVALFWGERDNVLPIAHAERAMAYLDDIEITRFACGHHPHLEVPGRFSGALMSFLDRA